MYMYNTGIILKSNEVTKNLSIRSCRSLNLINEIMVKFQARINDLEARNLIGCKSLRQIVDLCNAEQKHVIDVIAEILDIANDTGFPNLKAYNTRFRELFERTPSEYRSSLKQVRVRDSLNYKQAYIDADNAEITEKLNQYASFNEPPFSYPVTLQDNTAPNQTSSAFSQEMKKTLDDVSRQLTELSSKLKALKNTHL